jgi:rare lipoprotein A
MIRRLTPLLITLLLAACAGVPPPSAPVVTARPPSEPLAKSKTPTRKVNPPLKKGGGFYKDDGPADDIPDGLDDIPDAEPKWEPLHKPATRPYVVFGKEYVPNTSLKPYKARGIASWYGKKFHGQKTSIGEPYNMFAMTAAHPTLALPSYVRVTHVQSGEAVIVRVIDRGPFHADRIIDLSYSAAYKLGLIHGGSGQVEVEAILPGEPGGTTYAQPSTPAAASRAEEDEISALARQLTTTEMSAQSTSAGASAAPGGEPVKGVYLQLGAFANADNAENFKNHLSRDLDWLTEPMRIQVAGGIHRLHLGPYGNRAEADKMAEKIRLAVGFKPTAIIR